MAPAESTYLAKSLHEKDDQVSCVKPCSTSKVLEEDDEYELSELEDLSFLASEKWKTKEARIKKTKLRAARAAHRKL